MNVAIIIGVSDYGAADRNLPACTNDISVMSTLLAKTEKYDQTLQIDGDAKSASVKDRISAFVAGLQGETIDEVFFYFSGHGEYFQDHFYYLLSDYDPKRRNQTALDNSELDSWLRSLNAEMTIKAVDACHSGVQYIKEPGAFRKYLQESQNGFKKCYFFFSSGTTLVQDSVLK